MPAAAEGSCWRRKRSTNLSASGTRIANADSKGFWVAITELSRRTRESLRAKRFKGTAQLFGHGNRLQIVATRRDEDEMSSRHQLLFDYAVFVLAPDLEVQTQRCPAQLTDINADFQKIVQLRSAMKVAFEMHAR